MDLTYSKDEQLLAESARAFVSRDWPTATVRRLQQDPAAMSPLWAKICELGWPAIAVPEASGGLGGTLVDLAVVVEELGRGAVSSPLITTVAYGALPLPRPGLVGGESIATPALLEPDGRTMWPTAGAGATLSGTKVLVPFAEAADLLMVAATLDGVGEALLALPLPDERIALSRHEVSTGDPLYRIDFHDVVVGDEHIVATGAAARDLVARSTDVAAVLAAAHTVGLCEGALALAVSHAKSREQFGRPIGAFQSVANRCADMRVEIDACRFLVLEAAWRLARGLDAEMSVATAKTYTNLTVRTVTMHAHQVHGAIGFSTEHDLHLFTRRAKAFEQSYGDHAAHLERVAVNLGL